MLKEFKIEKSKLGCYKAQVKIPDLTYKGLLDSNTVNYGYSTITFPTRDYDKCKRRMMNYINKMRYKYKDRVHMKYYEVITERTETEEYWKAEI